jgi:hypothetical protein
VPARQGDAHRERDQEQNEDAAAVGSHGATLHRRCAALPVTSARIPARRRVARLRARPPDRLRSADTAGAVRAQRRGRPSQRAPGIVLLMVLGSYSGSYSGLLVVTLRFILQHAIAICIELVPKIFPVILFIPGKRWRDHDGATTIGLGRCVWCLSLSNPKIHLRGQLGMKATF